MVTSILPNSSITYLLIKKGNLIATQMTEKGKHEPGCSQELMNKKITKEEPNDEKYMDAHVKQCPRTRIKPDCYGAL